RRLVGAGFSRRGPAKAGPCRSLSLFDIAQDVALRDATIDPGALPRKCRQIDTAFLRDPADERRGTNTITIVDGLLRSLFLLLLFWRLFFRRLFRGAGRPGHP